MVRNENPIDMPAARPDQATAPVWRSSCSSPSSRMTLWMSCGVGEVSGWAALLLLLWSSGTGCSLHEDDALLGRDRIQPPVVRLDRDLLDLLGREGTPDRAASRQ